MGTRHIIAIFKDGEYKVAQYGQWDGYPTGQGDGILKYLKIPGFLEKLENNLKNVSFADEAYFEEVNKKAQLSATGWMNMEEAERFQGLYPELSRDCGCDILGIIAQNAGTPIRLSNSLDFVADGLFCEWAYVIDFDQRVLEVYEGFNKKKEDTGVRWTDMIAKSEESSAEYKSGVYYPPKLVATYSLDDLPDNDEMQRLEKSLDTEEEESNE